MLKTVAASKRIMRVDVDEKVRLAGSTGRSTVYTDNSPVVF